MFNEFHHNSKIPSYFTKIISTFQKPNSNEPIGFLMLDSNSGLHHDEAGNAFVCDPNGIWIPHHDYAFVCTFQLTITLL